MNRIVKCSDCNFKSAFGWCKRNGENVKDTNSCYDYSGCLVGNGEPNKLSNSNMSKLVELQKSLQ